MIIKTELKTAMIDLDNVMVNLPVVEDCSRELGLKYTTGDVMSWGYKEFPEELRRLIYKKFSDPCYMCNLKPFPWVTSKIKELWNRGIQVICITQRDEIVWNGTSSMVNHLFRDIKATILCSDKSKILLHNSPNYYVDDNPACMKAAHTAGIKTYLVSNENTKYNHEYVGKRYVDCVISSLKEFCPWN